MKSIFCKLVLTEKNSLEANRSLTAAWPFDEKSICCFNWLLTNEVQGNYESNRSVCLKSDVNFTVDPGRHG